MPAAVIIKVKSTDRGIGAFRGGGIYDKRVYGSVFLIRYDYIIACVFRKCKCFFLFFAHFKHFLCCCKKLLNYACFFCAI